MATNNLPIELKPGAKHFWDRFGELNGMVAIDPSLARGALTPRPQPLTGSGEKWDTDAFYNSLVLPLAIASEETIGEGLRVFASHGDMRVVVSNWWKRPVAFLFVGDKQGYRVSSVEKPRLAVRALNTLNAYAERVCGGAVAWHDVPEDAFQSGITQLAGAAKDGHDESH